MQRFGFLLLPLLFVANTVLAQISTPKYANEFLNIGVGARALGMSGTQASFVNDVSAGVWNPAGLAQLTYKTEFTLMHNEHFAGIANHNYAAGATRLDSNSVFAVSYIRFSVDDIPDTRFLVQNGQIDYSRIRRFSSADNAVFLSYARSNFLVKGLSFGGSLKILFRNAGNFANAWGFGLDAGAQYRHKNWQFGAVLKDIGTFTAWNFNTSQIADAFQTTGNTIPQNSIEATAPRLVLGAGRYFAFGEAGKFGLLAAADFDLTFDGERNTLIKSSFASIDPKAGIEANYGQIVFLRLGAGQIQKIKSLDGESTSTTIQPNFGIGFRIRQFSIDYALTDVGNQAEALYSNVFSLKVGLR